MKNFIFIFICGSLLKSARAEEKCHNMAHMQKVEISFNKSYFYDSMMQACCTCYMRVNNNSGDIKRRDCQAKRK